MKTFDDWIFIILGILPIWIIIDIVLIICIFGTIDKLIFIPILYSILFLISIILTAISILINIEIYKEFRTYNIKLKL